MSTELSCKELVELVTDYFEDKLPAPARRRFEAHLSTCRGCQIYLEQMRQTLGLLGALSEDSLSLEAEQELLQVFRNWKAQSDALD